MVVGHALTELLDGVRGALLGGQLAELHLGHAAARGLHHELPVAGGHPALGGLGVVFRRLGLGLLRHHGRRQRQDGSDGERDRGTSESHAGYLP